MTPDTPPENNTTKSNRPADNTTKVDDINDAKYAGQAVRDEKPQTQPPIKTHNWLPAVALAIGVHIVLVIGIWWSWQSSEKDVENVANSNSTPINEGQIVSTVRTEVDESSQQPQMMRDNEEQTFETRQDTNDSRDELNNLNSNVNGGALKTLTDDSSQANDENLVDAQTTQTEETLNNKAQADANPNTRSDTDGERANERTDKRSNPLTTPASQPSIEDRQETLSPPPATNQAYTASQQQTGVNQDATLLNRDIAKNDAAATYQTDANMPDDYRQTASDAERINNQISDTIGMVKAQNQQKINAHRQSKINNSNSSQIVQQSIDSGSNDLGVDDAYEAELGQLGQSTSQADK